MGSPCLVVTTLPVISQPARRTRRPRWRGRSMALTVCNFSRMSAYNSMGCRSHKKPRTENSRRSRSRSSSGGRGGGWQARASLELSKRLRVRGRGFFDLALSQPASCPHQGRAVAAGIQCVQGPAMDQRPGFIFSGIHAFEEIVPCCGKADGGARRQCGPGFQRTAP